MDLVDHDGELMLRYRSGDVGAFEILYARHKGPLYRYLLRHVRHAATANDLFQEVWSRVVAARSRYVATAKFATFLFHIAHNCAVDYHRRLLSTPIQSAGDGPSAALAEPELPEDQRPDRLAEFNERQSALLAALAALPAEQREAFLLHEEGGLNIEEIARVTSVGSETAKSRLRYAVQKLKKSLMDPVDAGYTAAVARAPERARARPLVPEIDGR